jgi:Zn-dependent protease
VALPAPAAGRQGLVSFRLLGFPVSIHTSFLVVVGFFGFTAGGGVEFGLVWLVVATVSVLAHELGHALVAAPAHGQPRIDLYGMAGLTTWQPGRASRARRVAVSVAGPGAGVALGVGILVLWRAVSPPVGSLVDNAFNAAVFVNLFWGLLNLLPILPLDGGQVARAIMPGRDEAERLRRTAYLSLGTAAAVVALAVAAQQIVAAVLLVYIAMGNVQTLRALKQAKQGDPFRARLDAANEAIRAGRPEDALRALPDPPAVPPRWAEDVALYRAMALLRLDRAREAQEALVEEMPDGTRADPVIAGAVLLANGQERLASESLDHALRTDPRHWAVRELVALLIRRGDDVDAVLKDVTPEGAVGAMTALYAAGRFAESAKWGERAVAGGTGPLVAYEAARAWARAGEPDRALRLLDDAAMLGFADVARVGADPDLANARALPGYEPVVRRIRDNGLGVPGPHPIA